jgi:hypothetical protein
LTGEINNDSRNFVKTLENCLTLNNVIIHGDAHITYTRYLHAYIFYDGQKKNVKNNSCVKIKTLYVLQYHNILDRCTQPPPVICTTHISDSTGFAYRFSAKYSL